MSEKVKTIIFALVALAVVVTAVVSRPKQEQWKADSVRGTHVFDEFDGAEADRIRIVKYNEELDKFIEFELARDSASDVWVIPSAEGYPVESEDRITDVTLMLDELEIVDVASEVRDDHEYYGVVSPTAEEVKERGPEGVGILLSFEDDKKELASLVIGHAVKDAEGQRFVRRSDQNAVHVVEIDPDRLSTRFEDWIEKDLLRISSPDDIEGVTVKNYTCPPMQKKSDFAAECKEGKWGIVELTRYSENRPIAGVSGAHEELNKEKLEDLRTAVDGLEIVKVLRRPKGLGVDLKVDAGFNTDMKSLGYHITPDTRELLSASSGEVRFGMKDAVEYVLRFGKEAELSSDDEETRETADTEETEKKKYRYLFVMARVDMSKLPEPEDEDLPKLPDDTAGSSNETADDSTVADEAESTETSEDVATDANDAAAGKRKPTENAAKDDAMAKPKIDKEAEEAEIIKERDRISKENERKRNKYEEDVQKAKVKVAELNTRFGPWYYVVSDEQCKKIFLGLDELVKKKQDADVEGDGVDAFRDLKDKGLKKDETGDSAS